MRKRHVYDPIILEDARKKSPPYITVGILLPKKNHESKVTIYCPKGEGGKKKIYNMTRRSWFKRYNTILVPIKIEEPMLSGDIDSIVDYSITELKIPLTGKNPEIKDYNGNTKSLKLSHKKINIIVYHENCFDPCDSATKDILKCIYKFVNTCKYNPNEDFKDCLKDFDEPPKKVGNSILIG